MAYNYMEDCEFIVEYEHLSKAIEQLDIFTNKKMMAYYIKKWTTLLKSVDDSESMERHFKRTNKDFFEKYQYEPEYYYTVVFLNGFAFQIAFNIELLHRLIDKNPDYSKKMLTEVDKKNFFGMESTIQCQKISGVNKLFREDKERPLYICQMHTDKKLCIVIDGTYRLNYKKSRQSIFECYFLSQEFMVNYNAFLSPLDELMYILNNELISFKQFKHNGTDDLTLLANSYIMSNKPADFFELDNSFSRRIKTNILYQMKK